MVIFEHNFRSTTNSLMNLFQNSSVLLLWGIENKEDLESLIVEEIAEYFDKLDYSYYDYFVRVKQNSELYYYLLNDSKIVKNDNPSTIFHVDEETLFYIKLKYNEHLVESFWDFQSKINIRLRYEK